jgi:hypothetical protein
MNQDRARTLLQGLLRLHSFVLASFSAVKPVHSLICFASMRQSENPLHRGHRPIESIVRNICPKVSHVSAWTRLPGDLRCLTTHSQSR